MATATLAESMAASVEREDFGYEIVRGQVVELAPMSTRANVLKSRLDQHFGGFVRSSRCGEVVTETLFVIDDAAYLHRRPDVAFVSYDRWPRGQELTDENAWAVVPDIAIEVVSPSDEAEKALEKIREYLAAGVRLVWAVYPRLREIHVFDGSDLIRVVRGEGVLDGGDVVPGFRLTMATLFDDAKD